MLSASKKLDIWLLVAAGLAVLSWTGSGRQYYCDIDGDVLIEDRCFRLRGYGRFFDHVKACGPHHTIHTVESHKALLWVSQLLSVVVNEVWVGNSPDSAKRFGAVLPESGTRSVLKAAARDQLVVKARIGECCADGIEVGGLIYANPNDTKAFLCSRPAGVFVEGIEMMASKVRALDYKVTIGRDGHGDPRAFTVIDAPNVVQDDVFPNGYVASQLDFFDEHEYRRILSEFSGSVLLTTLQQRSKSQTSHPQCAKDAFVETNANDNEVALDASSSHWSEMASDQCLTRQHSMVAITKAGYTEVTKAGHYQIMCTFGSLPNLRVRNGSRLECDRAARFDSQTGQCLCRHPMSDCKLKDTKTYGAHPTEQLELWSSKDPHFQQLTFVADMLQHVENVRAAVVVLSCPAYVDLPMDTYTADDLR
ncbi:unnamed protein product [Heligmosomoides polygyrus]|uniref:C-type lectin domain-containing protein n=1 Tax=Heligmosomoides polygyrus TaxID=6339 RepID=A0A183FUM7_HELPZ|nr:unnamed protein product [Heligmosomoides polygyrus]